MKISATLSLVAALLIPAGMAVAQSGATSNQISTPAASITAEWPQLMEPADLSQRLFANGDMQVIDIRSKKFLKHGVIPNAAWMPFADWRGPKSRPGNPPSAEKLEQMLGAAGLTLDKPIVIHNHTGRTVQTGRAAIVYWILKSAGAEQVAILHGGFKGWSAGAYPTVEAHPSRAQSSVDVAFRYDWWADPMDILAVSTKQTDGAILDSRLDAQVRKSVETGKPMMSMPFAQYIPADFFANQLSAKNLSDPSKQEFVAALKARGVAPGESMLISVCQTGELSALSWFYASEIVGLENVRYYPDALQGWKSDGGVMFGLKASLQ